MLKELAEHISLKLVTSRIIKIENREFYTYGLELLISKLMFFLIVLILAMLTKMLLLSVIFIITYTLLRQYTGGFHCNTSEMCLLVSILLYLFLLFLVRIDFRQIEIFLFAFSLLSFIVIVVFSPIVSENNPITHREKVKYRIYSIIIAFLWLSAMTISFITKLDYVFYPTCWSLSADAVLILLTLRRCKNEKSNAKSSCTPN